MRILIFDASNCLNIQHAEAVSHNITCCSHPRAHIQFAPLASHLLQEGIGGFPLLGAGLDLARHVAPSHKSFALSFLQPQ